MGALATSNYDSNENSGASRPADDSAIPIIDLVRLARQSLGDQELEAELLEMFERQSARILGQLIRAGADRKSLSDLAHTLKGSALAVGAERVARKAARLEALCAGSAPQPATAEALTELGGAVDEARGAIVKLIG
jgi:HPt (histidine-containing phosphotransfer) domain-containing protein